MSNVYTNPHGENCPWYDFTELVGAPNIKWCEETLCQWISEPANTWSNLIYIFLAFLMNKKLKGQPKVVRFFSFAMLAVGVSSFVYHMSNNYLSQLFDFVGMFIFIFWVLLLNLKRLGMISISQLNKIYVAMVLLGTGIVHLMYLNGLKFQSIVLVGILSIIFTEYLCSRKEKLNVKYSFYFGCLAFFAFAATFSFLDHQKIWCDPTNHIILQGHAIWHILNGIGIYLVSIFYANYASKYQKAHGKSLDA